MHNKKMKPFRGQFFYGQNPNRPPENFEMINFGRNGCLCYHPELPVAKIQIGEWSSFLIGQVFDPMVPANDIDGILKYIMEDPESIFSIANRTNRLSGRWALMLMSGAQEIIIHDAGGTMPIVAFFRDGVTSVASSTKLLSFCVEGLEEKPDVEIEKYQSSSKFHAGLAYPVRLTEYADVKALLPNHYLDLKQGSTHRYYPVSKLPQVTAKVASLKISEMLKNIVLSVSLRSDIAVAVTSGYDSRIIVGAIGCVPDALKKATFFTMIDDFGCPPGHFDTVIGHKICEAIGGNHIEILSPLANECVQKMCHESEKMKAPRIESWAGSCLSEQFKNRTVLTGWCGEIGAAHNRWDGSDQVTVEQIMDLGSYQNFPHLLPEFEEWFSDATDIRDRYHINILDLYFWEHRMGRTIASKLNIINSSCNWVSIYSCRNLINIMLSVPEAERGGPNKNLHTEIIRQLDSRLLKIPFNPYSLFKFKKDAKKGIKKIVASVAKALGIYDVLIRFYRKNLK